MESLEQPIGQLASRCNSLIPKDPISIVGQCVPHELPNAGSFVEPLTHCLTRTRPSSFPPFLPIVALTVDPFGSRHLLSTRTTEADRIHGWVPRGTERNSAEAKDFRMGPTCRLRVHDAEECLKKIVRAAWSAEHQLITS